MGCPFLMTMKLLFFTFILVWTVLKTYTAVKKNKASKSEPPISTVEKVTETKQEQVPMIGW